MLSSGGLVTSVGSGGDRQRGGTGASLSCSVLGSSHDASERPLSSSEGE